MLLGKYQIITASYPGVPINSTFSPHPTISGRWVCDQVPTFWLDTTSITSSIAAASAAASSSTSPNFTSI